MTLVCVNWRPKFASRPVMAWKVMQPLWCCRVCRCGCFNTQDAAVLTPMTRPVASRSGPPEFPAKSQNALRNVLRNVVRNLEKCSSIAIHSQRSRFMPPQLTSSTFMSFHVTSKRSCAIPVAQAPPTKCSAPGLIEASVWMHPWIGLPRSAKSGSKKKLGNDRPDIRYWKGIRVCHVCYAARLLKPLRELVEMYSISELHPVSHVTPSRTSRQYPEFGTFLRWCPCSSAVAVIWACLDWA